MDSGRRVLQIVRRAGVFGVVGVFVLFAGLAHRPADAADAPPVLAGTRPLTDDGDIASKLVDGVDKFLLNELHRSIERRKAFWKRDLSSAEAFARSIEPNRQRLAKILGVRDPRKPFESPEMVGTVDRPAWIARGDGYDVFAVRWPAMGDVYGEGLLLTPTRRAGSAADSPLLPPIADVVALPDADQTPEQLCGLTDAIPAESQFARRLAASGCRVLVPALVNREMHVRAPPGRANGAKVGNREFLYRSAFVLGRHLIGYELQKVLAGVDWFVRDREVLEARRAKDDSPATPARRPIGVIGYGEGGMLALYAGALDDRIDACCVSGYFGSRQSVWEEPIERNVFGLLEQFGDAELALMLSGRRLVVESVPGPQATMPGEGGAPGKLAGPFGVDAEILRYRTLAERDRQAIARPAAGGSVEFVVEPPEGGSSDSAPRFCGKRALQQFLNGATIAADAAPPKSLVATHDASAARHARQFRELDRHNQQLLHESAYVRADFMKKLNFASLDEYQKSVEAYREIFRNDVIGAFDYPLLPFNARSRKAYETPLWTGYEVTLDVWQDVVAYGILLVPNDLKPGEKRPVVVCQHGLEGRPQQLVAGDHPAYHDFAAKLCERGFITFAPQNLYLFKDRFRTLQRKANPLKKTLFSVIVPQHQQIVNWLKTLPGVDGGRIGFYGLSYGGKSAMRIPPLVTDYSLSICSADFNEWVQKNASTRLPFSYVWTGEYEIYEFDLGGTFNYAEMAALICPRPFMVERGHMDGVSTDEWVSFEFAKAKFLYSHRLKISERCELETFDGPHTIHGKGTFEFLHKHLGWKRPEAKND